MRRAEAIVDCARRLGANGTGQPKWTKEEFTTLPPLMQILSGSLCTLRTMDNPWSCCWVHGETRSGAPYTLIRDTVEPSIRDAET